MGKMIKVKGISLVREGRARSYDERVQAAAGGEGGAQDLVGGEAPKTMTMEEAIERCKTKAERIRHRYFSEGEYLWYNVANQTMYTEDGVEVKDEFWALRNGPAFTLGGWTVITDDHACNPCWDAQLLYCAAHNLPVFAMPSHNHYHFRRDERKGRRETLTIMFLINCNYDLEKAIARAGSEFITGCPGCGATWCD